MCCKLSKYHSAAVSLAFLHMLAPLVLGYLSNPRVFLCCLFFQSLDLVILKVLLLSFQYLFFSDSILPTLSLHTNVDTAGTLDKFITYI